MTFEYKGRKVEILRAIVNATYSIYLDGNRWAWGWPDIVTATKNAKQLIDAEETAQ